MTSEKRDQATEDYGAILAHMKSGGMVRFADQECVQAVAFLNGSAMRWGLKQIDIYRPGGKRKIATSGMVNSSEILEWLETVRASKAIP